MEERRWLKHGCGGLWLGVQAEMCFILYSHRWLTVTQTDNETSEGDSIALQRAHRLRRLLLTVQLHNFSCEINDYAFSTCYIQRLYSSSTSLKHLKYLTEAHWLGLWVSYPILSPPLWWVESRCTAFSVRGPYLAVKHWALCCCLNWHGDGGEACHPR